MLEHSHTFDWKNTQILDTEPNYFKRLISEMLHIKEQPNGINTQTDTEFLTNHTMIFLIYCPGFKL